MERMKYKEIDLKIELKNGLYEVNVSSECGGNGTGTFAPDELNFSVKGSNESEAKPNSDSLPTNLSLIKIRPPSLAEARAFGQLLFNVIFKTPDTIRVLDRCFEKYRADKEPLRFWLHLSKVPELAGLPWEFLSLVPQDMFFTKTYHSIVRYLDLNISYDEKPLAEPPLRILAVLSNPKGAPPLDVSGELEKLQAVIKEIDGVVLDPLYNPTLKALRKRLFEHMQKDPYHVFHFIGHAVFDSSVNQGKLIFENEAGGISQVSAKELGERLAAHPSLRLAVINACEGARTSAKDAYTGVAQTLLHFGAVTKVVAMQYVISDYAAHTFAQCFYNELLQGKDIDTAIAVARMTISDIEHEEEVTDFIEWGTPVIYMRAKDSRLVDFVSAPKKEVIEELPPTEPTPKDDQTQADDVLEEHYREVIKTLTEGQLVPFLGLDVNLFNRTEPLRPPAYDELFKELARFSKYPHEVGLLAGVSQYAQLPNRLAKLYDTLDPLLNHKEFQPTKLHKFWAKVASAHSSIVADVDPKRRQFLIVTMNYDRLLEREFIQKVKDFHVFSYIAEGNSKERGKFLSKHYHNGTASAPVLIDIDNKELTDERPVILNLPGSIEPFNSKIRFAITEDQYFDLLTNRDLMKLLPSQVMDKLRGSSHLFLGWTLSDWSLRAMLYLIWEKPLPPYDSWTIQKAVTPFERKYWEACQVKIIEEDLAGYITGLRTRLLQLKKRSRTPSAEGFTGSNSGPS